MLALAARWHGPAMRQLLPAAALAAQLQQERGMRLFEIFSKEEREKRKAKLKEEMDRGYFDDFREFRDSGGKVFRAPERLLAASHAPPFPRLHMVRPDGSSTTFPPAPAAATSSSSRSSSSSAEGVAPQSAPATLACLAFRAGAQPMLEAWAAPWSQRFQGREGVALYELAIVEGVVMRMWPFRQVLLRAGAASASKYALPCRHLHHFGDMERLRADLHLTNLLTGYVFLLDGQGRLRWRGSGSPSDQELQTLLRCTEELLEQQQAGQQQAGQQQAGWHQPQQQQQLGQERQDS